jgi:Spy/CpxP family protein refolding chaperone
MREVRQAIERVIRAQVKPTDAQMTQLQAVDRKYEPQKVQLNREELDVRRQLRNAMMDSTNVDENRISQLLDRLVQFPVRRAALMESEQKELAGFLSPLQRARYGAIQEQLRRRIEQGRGGPPPGPPPGLRE